MSTVFNRALMAIAKDYNIPLEDLQKYTPKSTKSRRGRKSKQEYIETEEWVHDSETYLVDAEGNVYTYNVEKPHLIGYRTLENALVRV